MSRNAERLPITMKFRQFVVEFHGARSLAEWRRHV
jgi:hypothetical protein